MRVLLGLVEVAAGDRDLRERGERQSQLQRVLRALGDVAALERACLGLVEPAQPGEHERHPEHRPTREQRLVGRGARVGHAVLQRRQRTVQVVARPLRHAERGGGARVGRVVVVLFGDRHGPARALRRLLHAPLDPVRLRQLHQCLGRQLGVVGLELVDQLLERLAVGHHRQHLAGADAAADAPEVELGAGGGVGVGAEQVERGLEVGDGLGQLQVAPPAQPRPAVQLGQLGRGLRPGERGLVVAGGLVPRAPGQRVVARRPHALERVVVDERAPCDEVVRDRTILVHDGGGARVLLAAGRRRRARVRGVRVDRVTERERGAVLDQHPRVDRLDDGGLARVAQREDGGAFGVGPEHRGGERDARRGLRQRRPASRPPPPSSGAWTPRPAARATSARRGPAPRPATGSRHSRSPGRAPGRWDTRAAARARARWLPTGSAGSGGRRRCGARCGGGPRPRRRARSGRRATWPAPGAARARRRAGT